MKMQAVLWYGPEQIRVEEIEVPEIGPDEVLVKIGTALTCGTDFKLFRQGHPILVKNIPSPFGHELSGTIAGAGSAVKNFREGDRVVAANSAPCGECFFCREQQWNLCENIEFLNGAYAEYIKIPARIVQKNLYKIPPHTSFKEAALTEPLACVLHCFDRLPIREGQTLCVIGAGTCGLLFTQLCSLHEIKLIVVSRGEEKLRVAKTLGAHETLSVSRDDFRERVSRLTPHGKGPDIVIDAAGLPSTWELATQLVRKGGSVWFYGGCTKGTSVSLDTYRMHYHEISCHGVFHHTPFHFEKSLGLIMDRKINVDALIHGEKTLGELPQIFRKGLPTNPLKIAVIP